MDKYTNSQKSGGKSRKSKLAGDMTFNPNDLNLLNSLSSFNYLNNHLNGNHLNTNQLNGSLPPDLLSNLSHSLTSLNNLATSDATQYNTLMQSQFGDQFNKNAIPTEFTSQSSMPFPNLPFYQQQSKSTLNNPNSPSTFAFHPFRTDHVQHSLLNPNFRHILFPPQSITLEQQLLIQQNLNSLGSLNGLNSSNNSSLDSSLTNGLNFLTEANLHNLVSTDHLNQFNKHRNQFNQNFLIDNLLCPTQLSNNNFNFNIHNSHLITTQPSPQPSQHNTNSHKCKRPKLEPAIIKATDHLKNEFELDNKEFNFLRDLKQSDPIRSELGRSDFRDDLKNDFKDDLKETKEKVQKFSELKVQTTNDHDKLEDEKKFSPDSSTELNAIVKEQKNNLHLIQCINNQSPVVTSTKSSEHSTSPDVQLNSSFNSTDRFMKKEEENIEEKVFVKDELLNDDSNHEMNNSLENDDENSLKIDLNDELSNDEENSNNESTDLKKSVDDEDLYRLISKKSFQTPINFKEVSLDRMSFDDEDEEDKSPINFNFKNFIDNDLNCSDVKDELAGLKKSKSKRRNRDNDSSSVNSSNPWSIRRSERIFLNEAFISNSNNRVDLNIKNEDFNLTAKDLEEPQRILLQSDDLLYCGLATKDEMSERVCVSLDDVDCAKNNQIFTFDKLAQEAIKEIKVKSMEQLHENSRVAAFWSLKTKYLYPGRIGKLSESLSTSATKKDLVLIHFDDGDKTRISMHEIRLLPTNFELKQLDTDEENSSKSSNNPTEEKKVEKLKIKLNTTGDQLVKKKKKKHSKDRHHKHHHKKHRNHDDEQSAEEEKNASDRIEDEDNDEWWSKVQTDQQWRWLGKPIGSKSASKSKKSKNIFYNAIIRGDETIELNDCAVFLSAGRPSLPFIGRIVKMWENVHGNMIVNVKWFYHPEETKKPYPKLFDTKGALFESSAHYDDNDVQTISHKVLVLPYKDYLSKKREIKGSEDEDDIYYFSGVYDAKRKIITIEKDVPMRK